MQTPDDNAEFHPLPHMQRMLLAEARVATVRAFDAFEASLAKLAELQRDHEETEIDSAEDEVIIGLMRSRVTALVTKYAGLREALTPWPIAVADEAVADESVAG